MKLTPRAACERLGISPRTLSRYVDRGRLHPERTAGGHRRFDSDEIDQLLAESNPPAPTELPSP